MSVDPIQHTYAHTRTTQGVLMPEACGGFGYADLDHCVQVVGYNDAAPEPYFKVRDVFDMFVSASLVYGT